MELNHDLVVEALATCRLPRLTIESTAPWSAPARRSSGRSAWLPLKQLAAERRDWTPLAPGVTGFEHRLTIPQWRLDVRVMIYRKHVRHESRKNFQLDLFTPTTATSSTTPSRRT